jgi:hypothetical protein
VAQGWREYEYPNEGFTVVFPAEPKVETTSYHVWGGRLQRNRRLLRPSLTVAYPPATEEKIRASALQFVRKLSGFNRPSQENALAFDEVADAALRLLAALRTSAPARDRAIEAVKARARSR